MSERITTTPMLLITANVGSIFEDPSTMLKIWTEEFLSTVARLDPKFIALHCQEVGGKNYEQSMKHVKDFVRLLMASEELRLFDKVRIYLDEDYSSAEKFTALGNFYFIHESIVNVLIYDFKAKTFNPVDGKEIQYGNIEDVTTKEKSKFPQDFFPECKWSRKGFLRTRWNLNGTEFDLINIHLFHDASNFVAMEAFPSAYSNNRRRALEHTLDRFHTDVHGIKPFFLFGDFNFRTNTKEVVKRLSQGLYAVPTMKNNSQEFSKMQYHDNSNEVVLSLGKKEFSHQHHQTAFVNESGNFWLKDYDKELEPFYEKLFEFEVSFPPSYPFEENELGARHYMPTRCPAWCDRVVLSKTARKLVTSEESCDKSVEYGLMGQNSRMGDHKPVYLMVQLLSEAGTLLCCTKEAPCTLLLVVDDTATDALVNSCTTCTNNEPPSMSPIIKFQRANSVSAVEKPSYALANSKCRCSSESSWSNHQHKLISNHSPLSRQLSRFSSHHSSSDEEWFEVVTPNNGVFNSQNINVLNSTLNNSEIKLDGGSKETQQEITVATKDILVGNEQTESNTSTKKILCCTIL